MRLACTLVLGVIFLAPSAGAQALLRRAERKLYPACKTVDTGAAVQMFETSVSTNVSQDRKQIWIRSMDVTYSTNSIRISSFAATTDAQGFPWVGFADPMILNANQGVLTFVRRSSDQPSVTVCGLQVD